MANFQKYPVYQYDEPATYDDFKGGINLDPSSENLADNEMRDCVNMEFSHVTLKKRKGAKKICRLLCEDTLNFIQGVTLFTHNYPFIIVAADGKLYYSLYIKGVDLELQRLHIYNAEGSSEKALDQFSDLEVYNYVREHDLVHSGYVYQDEEKARTLYFQNEHKIEFAAFDNKLYAATGTRIVVISVAANGVDLDAACASPYIPNGTEYQLYGENFMSPYPYMCMKSGSGAGAAIKSILIKEPTNKVDGAQDQVVCEAIMTLPYGKSSVKDYYYKWEVYDYNAEEDKYIWRTLISYEDSSDKLESSYSLYENNKITLYMDSTGPSRAGNMFRVNAKSEKSLDGFSVRCSFTDSITLEDETGEWVPTEIDGSYFGEFQISIDKDSIVDSASKWKVLQTCKKIIADGNKFILYDDAYNSGEWFKTVIGKPNYIVNRGCLNFKTTKNEQIIKVVHFKGVLVVFSHNKLVGGNIAVVSGNGDDDTSDSSYSPYARRVVNSEITCDSPESVQIAENLLFFKFRDTVYAIEGSDISSEIVTLYSLNDKLKSRFGEIKIPWSEPCVSEITNDYYGLIWKDEIKYENGEAYVARPAMRLKMYYKIGQEIDGKVFFPWLRDESSKLNSDAIFYIDGISSHIVDGDILQFDDEHYSDVDEPYNCVIKLKAYDLNYPKLSKFIRNMIINYHRPDHGRIAIQASVINEAGHELFDTTCSKESLQDLETVKDGTLYGKIGRTLADTKTYLPKYMFPLLQAAAELIVTTDGSFVLNDITFNYYTTDVPETNQFDRYSKIVRKSTPITRNRKIETGSIVEMEQDNLISRREASEVNQPPLLESYVKNLIRESREKEVVVAHGTNNFAKTGDEEKIYVDAKTKTIWIYNNNEYVSVTADIRPIDETYISELFSEEE